MSIIKIDSAYMPVFIQDGTSQEIFSEAREIWEACVVEYFDAEFARRTHFNHKTYQAGCKGPFCMAANRAVRRNADGAEPASRYLSIDPLLTSFYEQIQKWEKDSLVTLKREMMTASLKGHGLIQTPDSVVREKNSVL